MFYGKNNRSKNDILVYVVICLLIDGYIDPTDIENKFNLSSLTMYRYMSLIKTIVYDFEFYYVDIYYDRRNRVYRCTINTDYMGNNLSTDRF